MANLGQISYLLTLSSAVIMLMSCSYGVRPEPAVKSLNIGHIDNRTHQPRLSDALREELTRELASRNVRVDREQENEISGTLESLEVTPLAERGGTIVKFSVIIMGDFNLRKGHDGSPVRLETPLSYIVVFGSDVPLDDLYSMREKAALRAVADLAADLAEAAAMGR